MAKRARTGDEEEAEGDVALKERTKREDDEDEGEWVDEREGGEVTPFAVQRRGSGLHGWAGSRGDKISAIKVDTPTYGTETPPRQTPPTNIEKA